MKRKQESKLAVAIPSLYTLAVILYLYEKEDFMIKKHGSMISFLITGNI